MESCLAQVLQKDVGKRLQVGQELIDYFSDKQKSADLEHDQTMLDKLVDGLATSWVNSSNYKVSLTLGSRCSRMKVVKPSWQIKIGLEKKKNHWEESAAGSLSFKRDMHASNGKERRGVGVFYMGMFTSICSPDSEVLPCLQAGGFDTLVRGLSQIKGVFTDVLGVRM